MNKPDMTYRYSRAHAKLFKALTPSIQERVLQAKNDASNRDIEVRHFVEQVIALAESDAEL